MVNAPLKRVCQAYDRGTTGHAAQRSSRRQRRRPALIAAEENRGRNAKPHRRYGWAFVLLLPAAAAAISANALLLQQSPHPNPWFATRATTDWEASPYAGQLALPAPRPHLRQSAASPPAADGDPVVFAVQQALARAGYGPLSPDGLLGPRTGDAIRRFQLEEGLDVTGRIDEALISRLAAVGALDGE